MKRLILILLLGISVLLAFSGCGNTNEEVTNNTSSGNNANTPVSQTSETDSSADNGIARFPEKMFPIKHNGLWGIADEDGNIVIDFMYNDCKDISNGLWLVSNKDGWGFVDAKNQPIIPLTYRVCQAFSDGLCAVFQDSLWGFINEENEVIVPFSYEDCGSFSDGLAAVKKDDFWGFINAKNEVVIDFIYDEVGTTDSGDSSFKEFEHGLMTVSINDARGIIDTTGAYVVPLKKEHSDIDIHEKVFVIDEVIYNHDGKRIAEGDLLDYDDSGIIVTKESRVEIQVNNRDLDWIYTDWQDRCDAFFIDYSGKQLVDYSSYYKKHESKFANERGYYKAIRVGGTPVEINGKKYLRLATGLRTNPDFLITWILTRRNSCMKTGLMHGGYQNMTISSS